MRLALPVNAKTILKHVCDMAQMEYGISEDVTQIRNFYVVVLMLAGMIDDLDECLQEIKRARDMPISIIIVKVGA